MIFLMRILLREKQTNRFLMANGEWTSEAEFAVDFHKTNRDRGLALPRDPKDLEWFYVFGFPDFPEFDFAIQLSYAESSVLSPPHTSSAGQEQHAGRYQAWQTLAEGQSES
jgi:hypothetical protein